MTPTPSPTLARPKTGDDYIVWKVGPGVSPILEAEAKAAVHATHDFALKLGIPLPEHRIVVFQYHDIEGLATSSEATTGRTLVKGGAGRSFAEGRSIAVASRGYIVLNTSAGDYSSTPSINRRKIWAHEMFHIYQYGMSGLTLSRSEDTVPDAGPRWLAEGAAEFLAWQAIDALEPGSYVVKRNKNAARSRSVATRLNETETQTCFSSLRGHAYPYAFLAVELLAAQTGIRSLIDYFSSLHPGTSWQMEFQSHFGMTVGEFYGLFEAHRAAGFPKLELPIQRPTGPSKLAPYPTPTLLPVLGSGSHAATPSYLSWMIGSGVSEQDRETAIRAVKLMHDYAVSLGLPDVNAPIKFHIYRDQEELVRIYASVTGRTLERSRDLWVTKRNTAVATTSGIFLNAGHHWYSKAPRDLRMKVIAHELIHGFQHRLMGTRSSWGPTWLTEGTAEFLAYRALAEGNILPYSSARETFLESAEIVTEPLRDMEESSGFQGAGGGGRAYRFIPLAMELLASHSGESSFLTYLTLRGPESTWQESFQAAFGMEVEKFYELFEAHRAAGYPELELPKTRPE